MRAAYIPFAVGLAYGVGLGALLVQTSMLTLGALLFLIGVLVLIPVLAWVETRSHQHYVSKWEQIRGKPKSSFILIQYVLIRGSILCIALLVLASAKGLPASLALIGVLVIVAAIAAVGNQEWENCEQEHRALALQSAAERLKSLRLQVKEGSD
jgi:hypothetical protein